MSQPTNRLVPVSSICFTKDYYELIDENGNYMLPNHMENLMSYIETSFMMHRALLERKVFISANQYCSSILSKEEKEFWILYVAIQMMRTKLGVDLYTSYLSDYSENFSEIMIRNLALVRSCA
jgi:hypothetical protein